MKKLDTFDKAWGLIAPLYEMSYYENELGDKFNPKLDKLKFLFEQDIFKVYVYPLDNPIAYLVVMVEENLFDDNVNLQVISMYIKEEFRRTKVSFILFKTLLNLKDEFKCNKVVFNITDKHLNTFKKILGKPKYFLYTWS